jgi:hypothetical protein
MTVRMAEWRYHGANIYVEGLNDDMAGPMTREQLNDEMADQATTRDYQGFQNPPRVMGRVRGERVRVRISTPLQNPYP